MHERFQSCLHQTSTVETANSVPFPIKILPPKEKEQEKKTNVSVQVILTDLNQLHSLVSEAVWKMFGVLNLSHGFKKLHLEEATAVS